MNGAELRQAVPLAGREGGRALELDELVGVFSPFVEPRPGGLLELGRQVDLPDVDEAGGSQEPRLGRSRSHGTRTGAMGAPPRGGR